MGADGEIWATAGRRPVKPDLTKFPTQAPPADGNRWKKLR
jgi:hypothetical protein